MRRKDVKPPKGSTAFHPTQTIQSAPPKPDNSTQTIVQPSTPDVQIKQEVKVPNIVVWNVEETKVESIQIASKQMSEALSRKPETPEFQPPDPENVQKSISELTIAKTDVINLNPKLMLHPGASPEWNIGSDSGNPGPSHQCSTRDLSEETSCGIWSFSAPILVCLVLVESRSLPETEPERSPSLPKETGPDLRTESMAASWAAGVPAEAGAAKGTALEAVETLLRSRFPAFR